VGRSTQEAIDAGVVLGYAGMVTAMIRRFRDEIGVPARVIATGGWARALAEECPFDVVDDDLTVKGLKVVYELNAAATG
jgi:type III pantothenate kinase